MAEFSIQDAALTGFRVVREHPRAAAVWAVYWITLTLLSDLVLVGFAGADLGRVTSFSPGAMGDPAIIAAFQRLAPVYLAILAVSLVSNAIIGAAMNRAVLRPDEEGLGFIRLGADELRQLALGLLALAVFLGAYLSLVIALALVVGVLSLVLKAAAALAVVLLVIGVFAAIGFLAVRLSLASPLTFDTGRVNLFGSWTLTRGRFWPVLGTYCLALVLMVLVYLLSGLIIAGIGAILGGGDLWAIMTRPDTRSLNTFFTPFRLVQLILSGCVSALVLPILLTPAAAIYRSIAPSGTAAAAAFA